MPKARKLLTFLRDLVWPIEGPRPAGLAGNVRNVREALAARRANDAAGGPKAEHGQATDTDVSRPAIEGSCSRGFTVSGALLKKFFAGAADQLFAHSHITRKANFGVASFLRFP
ncbi:hypothetical protein CWS72_09985 [Telmatospirillum siberiense]|uniref:Uncharacterized protein n=1 Tax=Telmatospirillum siberiense TaxID=382514 RepID=A0A2N3PW76_9PROT|nr:hypothetical protein CWS72_09985 [Telmatospirillum siberiense]